jgi:uncharacterized protein (DUF2235 family)
MLMSASVSPKAVATHRPAFQKEVKMAKKIVVCFDGTWNENEEERDGHTNVVRLYRSIDGIALKLGEDKQVPDSCTIKWYDSGVGTNWYDHVRGGVSGYGLSLNIRQGYKFLIDHFLPGDEIYIFGFSRGAYTARSLAGLIRNSGLLNKKLILEADDEKYGHWNKRPPSEFIKIAPDDVPHIMDAYHLYRNHDEGADTDFAKMFRRTYAHIDVKIKLIGVWDTVGALGIPFRSFKSFNVKYFDFHDTELSGIVENAYHAIAIDEHREHFKATLWDPKPKPGQRMEQVWFAGSHADVGGGNQDGKHPLADETLKWMQEKVDLNGKGLTIKASGKAVVDKAQLASFRPSDSYKDFLGGVYRMLSDRHYRVIGKTKFGNEALSRVTDDIRGYSPKNPGYSVMLNEKRVRSEMAP